MKWHGMGGRTIAKVLAHDLHVVESFQPHLVILELGTNDLSHLDPTMVGSSLENLVAFSLQSPTCGGLPDIIQG